MHNSLRNCGAMVVVVVVMMMMMVNDLNGIRDVDIGVILDLDSDVGKSIRVCILMAHEEIYGARRHNFTSIIRYHFRDSKHDNFEAASTAIDLVKSTQVVALIGPQQSSQTHFILDIAYKSKVTTISPATTPNLSSKQNPYFIRIAQPSSMQAEPIAAIVKSFGWSDVVLVYENTEFGRGPIPYLFDAMVDNGIQVKHQVFLSPYSSDDSILQQLGKLKAMQTRVFIVHMLPSMASRFFKKANEVGMMGKGYVWIVTDVVTGLLHHLDKQDFDSIKGVVGVKPYIPSSDQLIWFKRKWRKRMLKEYPEIDLVHLDMFGIWCYDFIFALAAALQRVHAETMATIGTSELGSRILLMIRNTRLKGLGGDFHIVNGQLQTLGYHIVNMDGKDEKLVGSWTSNNGLSSQIRIDQMSNYTTNYKNKLGTITWPGNTLVIPNGRCSERLRVGVPALTGFVKIFEAYRDPITNKVYSSGFFMDIFYAVIDAMPYDVRYEIIPFETPDDKSAGNINDLVYQIVRGAFDMVAGDVVILWNRSNHVEFTLPYLEAQYAMLVPAMVDDRKNAWIFMKPLETKLWITIATLFIYTGLVVWVLEHRVNNEFRGRPHQQVGTIFWFSFSTLAFAHKEKLRNNLSRFVVIVWIFVVLVLTSSYTASLSSMLTVQNLQPTVIDIYELLARGDHIGYQGGSFVEGLLKNMGFPDEKLNKYNSVEEYDKALSDGTVSAIVDGIPYLKMLQSKYCNKYLIEGPTYNTAGYAFAFPKGSPHVPTFSRAILKVVEDQMKNISNKWFGRGDDCPSISGGVQSFDRLRLASFKGLFLIATMSSTYALVTYILMFVYANKEILASHDSLFEKLTQIVRRFNEAEPEAIES